MKMLFIGLLIGGVAGYYYGYAIAHYTIASECKKLGGFYVNDEVFECRLVDKKSRKEAE